jgi:hypothetical protein|tara:strand:- start:1992 stop:2435 length:444 start_codon:yes stop_codon:yes gene_type:complete
MYKYMDVKLQTEITRLDNLKNLHQREYLYNIEQVEGKIEQNKYQIERTESPLKRDILTKQRVYYKQEISSLDSTIEKLTYTLDEKINGLKIVLEEWEVKSKKEKESLEYNIEKLRDLIDQGNTNDVFEMFNAVVNSLEIIKRELNKE